MTATPAFDHIALTVPDLNSQVERLIGDFGMVAKSRNEFFSVLVDPHSGIKFELSKSADDGVHVRHLGFRTDDVDSSHQVLAASGMEIAQDPIARTSPRCTPPISTNRAGSRCSW